MNLDTNRPNTLDTIVSQFCNGCDWIIPLSLQQVNHFIEHIMIRQEHDTPNWFMEDSGQFTLKYVRKVFLNPGALCGWGKIIWCQYILWKVFYGRLPIDQHVQLKSLHMCSMCTLCKKQEESI